MRSSAIIFSRRSRRPRLKLDKFHYTEEPCNRAPIGSRVFILKAIVVLHDQLGWLVFVVEVETIRPGIATIVVGNDKDSSRPYPLIPRRLRPTL